MNTKDTPMDYKQFEGHTPGPWEAIGGPLTKNDTVGYWCVKASDGSQMFMKVGDKAKADAHLIAAAPDLLKENQELKLELQKQKELNAELVAVLDHFYSHGYIHGINYSDKNKIESLIKKSSEI